MSPLSPALSTLSDSFLVACRSRGLDRRRSCAQARRRAWYASFSFLLSLANPDLGLAEDDERDEPTRNLRFLVKWQSYSHIHNTWETYEYLKRFKGFKRVENYIKSVWATQQRILNDPATSREDLEALEIEKERQAEQLEAYKQVERIVAQRNAPANADIDHDHRELFIVSCRCELSLTSESAVEYLCKWRGLVYAESTWEDHDTVRAIAAEAIDSFLERTSSPHLPHKSTNHSKGRPAFHKMAVEPGYIKVGGTLKDFQITGLNWLAYLWSRGENGILADEVRSSLLAASARFALTPLHRWDSGRRFRPAPSSPTSTTSCSNTARSSSSSLFRLCRPGRCSSRSGRPTSTLSPTPETDQVARSSVNTSSARRRSSSSTSSSPPTSSRSKTRPISGRSSGSTLRSTRYAPVLAVDRAELTKDLSPGPSPQEQRVSALRGAHQLPRRRQATHHRYSTAEQRQGCVVCSRGSRTAANSFSPQSCWRSCTFCIPKSSLSLATLISTVRSIDLSALAATDAFPIDEENETKIRDLHGKLESIMLRRLKRDVIKELPTKSERILRVEMSNMQTWWYKNILTKVCLSRSSSIRHVLTTCFHRTTRLLAGLTPESPSSTSPWS